MGTAMVCALLAFLVGVVAAAMVKQRKKGKTSCGCAVCPMKSKCRDCGNAFVFDKNDIDKK